MAKPFFRGDVFGNWAFSDATAAPAEVYYYPHVVPDEAENSAMWGHLDKDGALIQGEVFKAIDAFTVNLNTLNAPTLEVDNETDSVFKGHIRIKWATI